MTKVIAHADSQVASGASALVFIDMINDFDFPGAASLARNRRGLSCRRGAQTQRRFRS